jgi:hypothetical protein
MSIHLRPLYVEQVSHATEQQQQQLKSNSIIDSALCRHLRQFYANALGRLPVQHATAWSSSLYTYTDQGVISRTENAIQASQIQTDINRHLLDRYTRLHHNVS